MRILFPLAAAVALLTDTNAAEACTFPLVPPKPGETQADYGKRNNEWLKQWQEGLSLSWQASQFDRAARVSLARIVAQQFTPYPQAELTLYAPPPLAEVAMQPIVALKGPLGAEQRRLLETRELRCAVFEDGSAARASMGDLVILFEREGADGAVSVNGILLDSVREPRLKTMLPAALRQAEAAAK